MADAPARTSDTFDRMKELGALLRELRREAGLKQSELAALMGRKGKGAHALISRMEKGACPDLAFRLVADYLRACRASISSIADIVNSYTAQPTVVEKQGTERVRQMVRSLPPVTAAKILNYDIQTESARARRKEKPEPVDERVERVRRMAGSWVKRQRVEDCLHAELNRMGALAARRFWLADYGRRVFKALEKSRGRDETRRKHLLNEVEETQVSRELDDAGRREIRDAVSRLFEEMEASGALDWLPPADEALRMELLTKGRRVKGDEQLCREEQRQRFYAFQKARNDAVTAVQQAYAKESGLGTDKAAYWNGAIVALVTIGIGTEPDSPERKNRVEQFITSGAVRSATPDQLRVLSQFVFAHLDPLRARIPPDPSR